MSKMFSEVNALPMCLNIWYEYVHLHMYNYLRAYYMRKYVWERERGREICVSACYAPGYKCEASIVFVRHGMSFSPTSFHQTLAGLETQHRYVQNLGYQFRQGRTPGLKSGRLSPTFTGTKVPAGYQTSKTSVADALLSKMLGVLH